MNQHKKMGSMNPRLVLSSWSYFQYQKHIALAQKGISWAFCRKQSGYYIMFIIFRLARAESFETGTRIPLGTKSHNAQLSLAAAESCDASEASEPSERSTKTCDEHTRSAKGGRRTQQGKHPAASAPHHQHPERAKTAAATRHLPHVGIPRRVTITTA